ncbi:hypothetical protein M011DRAFT_31786 [Sporormia fimetaria CBS 119925]|uniref:Uncharacterized protein n=1 Tax=Sporormia fimetaria CBS 119925 TaxID=1340428 RepID=A0A6A6VG78_9PLEO|nr:hypothetical protein M011DRAFT_31786 [Sporormia fimetaria CBS 119925]
MAGPLKPRLSAKDYATRREELERQEQQRKERTQHLESHPPAGQQPPTSHQVPGARLRLADSTRLSGLSSALPPGISESEIINLVTDDEDDGPSRRSASRIPLAGTPEWAAPIIGNNWPVAFQPSPVDLAPVHSAPTPSITNRASRRKRPLPADKTTEISVREFRDQQVDRSAILQNSMSLSRQSSAAQLEERKKQGYFRKDVSHDGRATGWAPQIRDMLVHLRSPERGADVDRQDVGLSAEKPRSLVVNLRFNSSKGRKAFELWHLRTKKANQQQRRSAQTIVDIANTSFPDIFATPPRTPSEHVAGDQFICRLPPQSPDSEVQEGFTPPTPTPAQRTFSRKRTVRDSTISDDDKEDRDYDPQRTTSPPEERIWRTQGYNERTFPRAVPKPWRSRAPKKTKNNAGEGIPSPRTPSGTGPLALTSPETPHPQRHGNVSDRMTPVSPSVAVAQKARAKAQNGSEQTSTDSQLRSSPFTNTSAVLQGRRQKCAAAARAEQGISGCYQPAPRSERLVYE